MARTQPKKAAPASETLAGLGITLSLLLLALLVFSILRWAADVDTRLAIAETRLTFTEVQTKVLRDTVERNWVQFEGDLYDHLNNSEIHKQ